MLSVKRKLLNVGGSTVVVLPRVWIESKGLKPRDQVEVEINDNLTIVAPKKPAEK